MGDTKITITFLDITIRTFSALAVGIDTKGIYRCSYILFG
jgi:hypothetical protein